MQAFYRKRLLKLAEHLEKGKLGHQRFDFAVLNVFDAKDREGQTNLAELRGCGTRGCAIGECPIVFPRHWTFRHSPESLFPLPLLRGRVRKRTYAHDSFISAEQFFGINGEEASRLFNPSGVYEESYYSKKPLSRKATRKQVARNIRAFVKLKEKGMPNGSNQ